MPHLIIESSLSLPKDTVEELHQLVGEQETVSIKSVKTRLYFPLISFVGEQPDSKHIAITLKLLPGRSLELKEQIATNLFDRASELISESSISVEIIDLETYMK